MTPLSDAELVADILAWGGDALPPTVHDACQRLLSKTPPQVSDDVLRSLVREGKADVIISYFRFAQRCYTAAEDKLRSLEHAQKLALQASNVLANARYENGNEIELMAKAISALPRTDMVIPAPAPPRRAAPKKPPPITL